MTRTRTQTTLTRLAQATAEVHAERALIEALTPLLADSCPQLAARREHLLLERDALYLTLRQFDEEIDGQVIGESWRWLRRSGCRTRRACFAAYLMDIGITFPTAASFQRTLLSVRALVSSRT